MIDVFFDAANARSIGKAESYQEAYKIMSDFIHNAEKNGFKWYYTRIAFLNEAKTLHHDVGSHSEFFDFICDTQEEYENAVAALRN